MGDGIRRAFWVAFAAAAAAAALWLWRSGAHGFYGLDYRVAEVLLALSAVCLLPIPLLLQRPEPPAGPAAAEAPPVSEEPAPEAPVPPEDPPA